MKTTTVTLLGIFLFVNGCAGETKVEPLDEKAALELSAKELIEPVGLISAYVPHLDIPSPGKYAPASRPDLKRASYFAANEIRHAANAARQRKRHSKSPITLSFIPTFEELTKACANPDERADVENCKATVAKLNKALETQAAAGKAAGISGTIPVIGPAAITDATRKEMTWFKKAIGPTSTEKDYLAKRAKTDISPGMLIGICRSAAAEADAAMNELERTGNEDVRKLAAHHKIAVDAQCNRLEAMARLYTSVEACKKPDADETLCKLACSKAKARIKDGIPAAAFAAFEEHYAEACEEDKK